MTVLILVLDFNIFFTFNKLKQGEKEKKASNQVFIHMQKYGRSMVPLITNEWGMFLIHCTVDYLLCLERREISYKLLISYVWYWSPLRKMRVVPKYSRLCLLLNAREKISNFYASFDVWTKEFFSFSIIRTVTSVCFENKTTLHLGHSCETWYIFFTMCTTSN